jgi:hypothetical protein
MSDFQSRYLCENVKFYSHHIDPVAANVPGVLSLANGHTATSLLPDQEYTFTVDLSGHLKLTGQASSPSPSIQPIDIAPNGDITIEGNTAVNITSTDGILRTNGHIYVSSGPGDTEGSPPTASLALYTDNSNQQFYTLYASNGSGAGLNDGHLQLYSYNDTSNNVATVFDITPQSGANATPSLALTCNASLNGQALGPVSRQYASQTVGSAVTLPSSNGPKSLYTFDLSGFATKQHFIVNVDSLSFSFTTGYSDPVNIAVYLCDASNGAKSSKACLAYPSGSLTSGSTFTMNNLMFTYTGTSSPSNLYLNAMVTTSAGPSAQLSSIAFNASIVAP